MTTIYLLEKNEYTITSTADQLERLTAMLPDYRRKKLAAISNLPARIDCVLSFLLLQKLLAEKGIIDFTLRYAANGKPSLTEYSDVFFNISHCKSAVTAAVGETPLGLDVLDFRKVSLRLAEKICSPAEKAICMESTSPQTALLRYFCQKEALSKLSGDGIRLDFTTLDVAATPPLFFEETPTYFLALYAAMPSDIVLKKTTLENLIY